METASPSRQLNTLLAKYNAEIRSLAKAALRELRKLMPGAIELIYDHYYALVIAFSPNERPSEAVLSLVLYPRHVNLCFLQGARIPDRHKLLRGSGSTVRHIRLDGASTLDRSEVRDLMFEALVCARTPFDGKGKRRVIIREVATKQLPRRPAKTAKN